VGLEAIRGPDDFIELVEGTVGECFELGEDVVGVEI
jgi:hypothetical protein